MFSETTLDFKVNNKYNERKAHLICPRCGKTVPVKVHYDTYLVNFPLYCRKCNKPTNISYSGGLEKVV